jgi:hypothetical protein
MPLLGRSCSRGTRRRIRWWRRGIAPGHVGSSSRRTNHCDGCAAHASFRHRVTIPCASEPLSSDCHSQLAKNALQTQLSARNSNFDCAVNFVFRLVKKQAVKREKKKKSHRCGDYWDTRSTWAASGDFRSSWCLTLEEILFFGSVAMLLSTHAPGLKGFVWYTSWDLLILCYYPFANFGTAMDIRNQI